MNVNHEPFIAQFGLMLEGLHAHPLTIFFLGSSPRFLHETIQKGLFTPTFLPVLLLAIRTTLFPFNTKPSQNATISTISSSTCSTVPQAEAGISSSASNSKIGSALSLASSLSSKLLPVTLQTRSEALSNAGENLSRRECAVSILSLIPRSVALTIFCIPNAQARNRGTTILNLKPRGIVGTSSNSGSRTTHDVTGYEVPKSSSISQQYPSPDPCKPDTNFHAFQAVHSALEPSDPSTTTNIDSTVVNRKARDSAGDSRVQTPVFSSFDNEVNTTSDDEENEEINEQEALLSAIENDILDVFADKYCNKHLMYSIIEMVLVKLLPEISEHGIAELMAERGV